MSHNVLNIHIVLTLTRHISKNATQTGKIQFKMRVMPPRHPQGGKQKLERQAQDYGAPICLSSVITWHASCYTPS